MNKVICWITIILFLIILILISINICNHKNTNSISADNSIPIHKSDSNVMLIYDIKGKLNYCILAKQAEYFSEKKKVLLLLTCPILTIYNENQEPSWLIKSDCARLTNNHMLYLHGHVEVNSTIHNSQLRKIITNTAQLNLTTQDIVSCDLVSVYGITFSSSGLQMRGNLRNKQAELIKKVRTVYAIQKE